MLRCECADSGHWPDLLLHIPAFELVCFSVHSPRFISLSSEFNPIVAITVCGQQGGTVSSSVMTFFCLSFLKRSSFTVLCYFQVYGRVIQYFSRLYYVIHYYKIICIIPVALGTIFVHLEDVYYYENYFEIMWETVLLKMRAQILPVILLQTANMLLK